MTTDQYLDSLEKDQKDLADLLRSYGISVEDGDTLTQQISKLSSQQHIYLVGSSEEMNLLKGMKKDDLCIIYAMELSGITEEASFKKLILKDSITLSTPVTEPIFASFSSGHGDELSVDIRDNSISIMHMGLGMTTIEYQSSDGLTYTMNEPKTTELFFEDPMTFMAFGEFNPILSEVIFIDKVKFGGLYTYTTKWQLLNIDINTRVSDLVIGSKAYTSLGVINGVLGDNSGSSLSILSKLLNNMDLSQLNPASDFRNLFSGYKKQPIILNGLDTSSVTDFSDMFNSYEGSSLDISNLDTSSAQNVSRMFAYCPNLTSLDFSNFKDTNISTATSFLNSLGSIESINLNDLSFSKVSSANSMFSRCSKLTSFIAPELTLSELSSAQNLFELDSKLTEINLPKFNPLNLSLAYRLFADCSSCTSILLPAFTGQSLTSISSMFHGCTSLEIIDISSLDFSNITKLSNAFYGVPTSCKITVKDELAKTKIQEEFPDLTNIIIKGVE